MLEKFSFLVPTCLVFIVGFSGGCSKKLSSGNSYNTPSKTINYQYSDRSGAGTGNFDFDPDSIHLSDSDAASYDFDPDNVHFRDADEGDYDGEYDFDPDTAHFSGSGDVVGQLASLNSLEFNTSKDKYYMHLLPDLIDFLRHIKSVTNDDVHICFLSRDCYFLDKLYGKMYPDDTNYEYVYSSRKLCYSESGHYVNYVSEIMKKNKETLWVDIQGSGDSHVYFFSKHFGTVPPKIFFKQNKMQGRYSALAQEKRPSASSLDLSLYENNITSFKSPDWVVDIDGRDWSKGAFYLEALNRAPHPSIIELDASGNPVYEQAPDYFDRNLEALLVAYEKILDNFWINDNINLRTDGSKYNMYKSDLNDNWNGLLALDIDGTITGDDFGLLEDLVNYSKDNKVKIIFITARWDPMISHRNGHLQDIMKYFEQQLDYPIDIWFNALSEKKSISYIAKTKVQQLEMARQELGLPKDKCMLVDDILVTVNLAQRSGFEHSTWVSIDEKIGINEDTMTNIKKMITDDTPVITDDQELENSSLEDQVSKVVEEKVKEQVTVKAENESPVMAPVTTSCKMFKRVDNAVLDLEEKIMIIAGGKALDHVFMQKERKPAILSKNQLMFCHHIRSECTFSI